MSEYRGMHRRSYALSALLLAAAVPLGLGAGARAATRPAEPPLAIDAILSLSGPAAPFGAVEQQSLQALAAGVNRSGGLRGRPLQFTFTDDASDPQAAARLVASLAAQNVPVIADTTLVLGSWTTTSSASPDDVLRFVMRSFRARGWKRIALAIPNDAAGRAFEQRLAALMQDQEFFDVTFVARERFDVANAGPVAWPAHIRAVTPDVVMSPAFGSALETLLRGLHAAGTDAPVYAPAANLTIAQLSRYASFAPKDLELAGARGTIPEPGASGALKRAQATYAGALKAAGLRPEFATQRPWDPAMALVEALRRLGAGATAAQVRDNLVALHGWTGIEGTYDFHAGRHGSPDGVALFSWDAAKGELVAIPADEH